jgi:hypothetical protein
MNSTRKCLYALRETQAQWQITKTPCSGFFEGTQEGKPQSLKSFILPPATKQNAPNEVNHGRVAISVRSSDARSADMSAIHQRVGAKYPSRLPIAVSKQAGHRQKAQPSILECSEDSHT